MARFLSLIFFFLFFLWTPLQAAEQFPFVGTVTGNDVNVRAGQSVNFDAVIQLQKGDDVVVIERNYSWYKIRLPQKAECYISRRFIQPRIGDIAVVTGHRVNLRSRPALSGSIMGQLREGDLVKVVSEEGEEWARIEPMKGVYGWIATDFVDFKSFDVPPERIVQEPKRTIYPRQETKIPETPEAVEDLAEAPLPDPGHVTASGRLEDLGNILQEEDIRYKLVQNGKAVYYLVGSSRVFDPFINLNVLIEGQIRKAPDRKYSVPVVVVSKVNLILNNTNQ